MADRNTDVEFDITLPATLQDALATLLTDMDIEDDKVQKQLKRTMRHLARAFETVAHVVGRASKSRCGTAEQDKIGAVLSGKTVTVPTLTIRVNESLLGTDIKSAANFVNHAYVEGVVRGLADALCTAAGVELELPEAKNGVSHELPDGATAA